MLAVVNNIVNEYSIQLLDKLVEVWLMGRQRNIINSITVSLIDFTTWLH